MHSLNPQHSPMQPEANIHLPCAVGLVAHDVATSLWEFPAGGLFTQALWMLGRDAPLLLPSRTPETKEPEIQDEAMVLGCWCISSAQSGSRGARSFKAAAPIPNQVNQQDNQVHAEQRLESLLPVCQEARQPAEEAKLRTIFLVLNPYAGI